jgi:GNAT superfamily N-acetyltransferase
VFAIRAYQKADWPGLCAVHDRSRPDELAGSVDARAFRPMADAAEADEFFDSETLVATVGDSIAGFVSWNREYVTWLYVDPAHYRGGIGRALLLEALRRCGPDAWVNMLAGNARALALYRGAGFDVVRSFPGDCDGFPCTCLVLALPTSYMHDPAAKRRL